MLRRNKRAGALSAISPNCATACVKLAGAISFAMGVAILSSARATVVRFNTVSGNIDVRFYNTTTPLNVANFLNYVTSGRYANTFIHRDVPGFVIQGGGYTYNETTNAVAH